jgi:hypothetical protein
VSFAVSVAVGLFAQLLVRDFAETLGHVATPWLPYDPPRTRRASQLPHLVPMTVSFDLC